MIIVSQNKEEIYNFEKISCISVEKNYHQSVSEKDFTYDIYIEGYIEDARSIGSYPSLDRAKEVLMEILNFYNETEMSKIKTISKGIMYLGQKIYYEMPEK